MTPPVIFIWTGNRPIPEYVIASLTFNSKTTSRDIIFITNSTSRHIPESIRQIELSSFYKSIDLSKLVPYKRSKFRDGFWLHTTERFFILNSFSSYFGVNKYFHAECDNIVFDLTGLAQRLDSIASSIFVPKDTEKRVIASLVYINNNDILGEFCQYVCEQANPKLNDMYLLSQFMKTKSVHTYLPTESAIFNNYPAQWEFVSEDDCCGIFDAASLGQYMFGVDPRNIKTPLFNRFINEYSSQDLSKFKFIIDSNRLSCRLEPPNHVKSYNVYNLHIHSKIHKHLLNDQNLLPAILNRLNNGKRSMISFNVKNYPLIRKIVDLF